MGRKDLFKRRSSALMTAIPKQALHAKKPLRVLIVGAGVCTITASARSSLKVVTGFR